MSRERLLRAIIEIAPTNLVIHLVLVTVSLVLSTILGILIGVILTKSGKETLVSVVLQVLNVMQTIPALAFVAISIPILGFGYKPTITVLVLQGALPIVKSTILGILEIDGATKDAGKGIGMSRVDMLFDLELPLAMPYIMSGIKIASTHIVSVATLAGFVGAGGLGVLISAGLSRLYPEYLIVGAVLCAIMALGINGLLDKVEKKMTYRIFGEKL